MKRLMTIGAALGTVLLAACGGGDDDRAEAARDSAQRATRTASGVRVAWDRRAPRMTQEELDRLRTDTSWMEVAQLDPIPGGAPERPNPERWEQLSAQSVNTTPQHVPLYTGSEGPSVLRTQILLDRALFSPGIMDGRWGKNTAEAVYWFQRSSRLPATARVDSTTFAALRRAAGDPEQLVVAHRLTADDVEGPFTRIPEDIYEHAELDCSCYESLSEKLSEKYHATPDLLEKLNPGVRLNSLRAGQTINVPAVREASAASRGQVAKLVVSGRGTYVHAVDASDRILYHFPSTLGGRYSPSPSGAFRVNAVTRDPAWHYQPDILVGVPDNEPEAMIPAGPNVAVGTVWIDLSEPHYGIHGTAEPQTIGYASSNGCVRLTNWDVEFLSRHVRPGTPVQFRDIAAAAGGGNQPTPTEGEGGTSASAPAGGSSQGTSAAARGGSSGGGRSGASAGSRGSESTRPARTEEQPKREEPQEQEKEEEEDAEHEGHEPRG